MDSTGTGTAFLNELVGFSGQSLGLPALKGLDHGLYKCLLGSSNVTVMLRLRRCSRFFYVT